MNPCIVIIGCGKLGLALSQNLNRAGYKNIDFVSKTESSAQKASKLIKSGNYGTDPLKFTKSADIVFITTPDRIIEDVCKKIACKNGFKKDSIVLHCSGSLPSTILSSAKKCGVYTGSIHPLQSFSGETGIKNPFSGIVIAIEGEDQAIDVMEQIAKKLDAGLCLPIKTESKTMYHAAAVVASNYLVTLVDFALELLKSAGISQEKGFDVLKPLIYGTLANIESEGTVDALTGPVARGDLKTIKTHIEHIKAEKENLDLIYKTLGLYTVNIAVKAKTIQNSSEKDLKKLFLT